MNKKIKIFAEFSAIIDTDMAVIKLIQKEYYNTTYMKQGLLDSDDDVFISYRLLHRDNPNPFTIILKDQYINLADGLYADMMGSRINDILELSKPNAIGDFFFTSAMSDYVILKVACRSEKEKEYIRKKINISNIECIDYDTSIDLKSYDCICLKDLKNIVYFNKGITFTRIYIPDYDFNVEKELDKDGFKIPLLEAVVLLGDTCQMCVLSPYKDLPEVVG